MTGSAFHLPQLVTIWAHRQYAQQRASYLFATACTVVSVRNDTAVDVCDVEFRFPGRATDSFGRLAPGEERSSLGDTRDDGYASLCGRVCDGGQLQCARVNVFLDELRRSRIVIVTQGSGRSDELVLRVLE